MLLELDVVMCFEMEDGANSSLIAPSHVDEVEIGSVTFIRDFQCFSIARRSQIDQS